jgi:hypothetical protein
MATAAAPDNCDLIFAAWAGLVGNRPWRSRLVLTFPMQQSKAGGSGSFLGKASDGNEYWIKPLNNTQGVRVPILEQIVGNAGSLIGDTCCSVIVVYIPKALQGWEFRPGRQIERGFAHASLALANATEVGGPPTERDRDDNAVRHVGYFALFDWCWGGDPQGLVAIDRDRAFYSHDHGVFLPPEGFDFTIPELLAKASIPHEFGVNPIGLDPLEVNRVATRLESLTRTEILDVVRHIPRSWPVTNQELEHVGAFLECRAPRVAERLRARTRVTP